MRFRYLFILLIIISAGCNTVSTPEKKHVLVSDTTHIQDTMLVIKDSSIQTAFADSIPLGAFQGSDSQNPGSLITILFNKEHRYFEQMRQFNGHVNKSEGTWQRKDGRIWLSHSNIIVLKFSFRKDSLFTVETNGRLLDSLELILVKRKLASESGKWKKQESEGIDFIANGVDPSWSMEMDNKKMVLFKIGDQKPVVTAIQKPLSTKDSSVYTLPVDNDILRITIIHQYFNDGITDLLYDNKVVARFKGLVYKGAGTSLGEVKNL